MRAALVLLLASTTAAAAPGAAPPTVHAQTIGEGLTLIARSDPANADNDRIVLREGSTFVQLRGGMYAYDWSELHLDAPHRLLSFSVPSCELDEVLTFTFDQLHALIAAERSTRALAAKDPKTAEAELLRATQLAPADEGYAFALAALRLKRGDTAAAAIALQPRLATAFEQTYFDLAARPDLRPLLAHPAITGHFTPGDAGLAGGTRTTIITAEETGGAPPASNVIGYAPATGLLAISLPWNTWGLPSDGETLELFDAATGRLVAATELRPQTYRMEVPPADAAKQDAANRARAAEVSAMLAQLGFHRVDVEIGAGGVPRTADGKQKLGFPHAKLGIVIGNDDTARLLQRDTVLGEASVLRDGSATYIPAARAVLLITQRAGHEGCEGEDPTMATVFPIPAGVTP